MQDGKVVCSDPRMTANPNDPPIAAELDDLQRVAAIKKHLFGDVSETLFPELMSDDARRYEGTIAVLQSDIQFLLDTLTVTQEQAQQPPPATLTDAEREELAGYVRQYITNPFEINLGVLLSCVERILATRLQDAKQDGAQVIMDALTPSLGFPSPLPPTEHNIQQIIRSLETERDEKRNLYEQVAEAQAAQGARKEKRNEEAL
jgi:hypothetical protein